VGRARLLSERGKGLVLVIVFSVLIWSGVLWAGAVLF
jgi:hypothetical protein